ncbi:polyprenyl synthetase family protein [Gordonia sinesedis]
MTPSDPPRAGDATPSTLAEVPAAVQDVLADFFARTRPVAEAVSPAVGDAAGVVADFVLSGGKRVRPMFAYAGWLCATTVPGTGTAAGAVVVPTAATAADALRVCAALELVQACALIHDDIIDHSDTRRGRPTVHRVFERRHAGAGWSGDSAEHGVAAAVLAGDLALAWADDLVHGYSVAMAPDGGTSRAARPLPTAAGDIWAAMRTEVLGGQFLDIVNERSGDESVESAYRVMEFKTAAYTVSRPLQLGAALAGASPHLLGTLGSVGHDLGVAFQLRDDLLGVFGDERRTGKPSGDDLVAGKRTALLAIGLARAAESGPSAAAQLRGLVGRPLTDDELATARAILLDVGAVDDVERRADELLSRAVATLNAAELDSGVRADLVALAHRVVHREA